ncbi:MAG: hypothetical protein DI629_20180 [Mesorhizobium amorphae]|nr:MAG: hypothetical protein DI629_20180 [Mesorhizobium amorphae]
MNRSHSSETANTTVLQGARVRAVKKRSLARVTILRTALLATVALAAFSVAGQAAFSSEERETERTSRAAPGIRLAQMGDVDVFYDQYGRRVILDSATGEVIAVEPARRGAERGESRRAERRRALQREELYQDDYAVLPDDPYAEDWLTEPEDYPADERAIERARRQPLDEARENRRSASRRDIEQRPLDDVLTARPEPMPRDVDPNESVSAVATPTVPGATVDTPSPSAAREEVAALQVLLDRAGASPGVIDGRFGSNVDKALAAYNQITGQTLRSTDAVGIQAALEASGGDPFIEYTITAADAAGPYVASVPTDYGEKAKLEALSYTSVTEALAERFHMDENYLKALNPEAAFNRPGTIIRVAQIGAPRTGAVTRIEADKSRKQVRAYDAAGQLVVAYPATIGSPDTPSPVGIHAVSRVALNPEYTYNPKINFQQGANDKVLRIPPGPNGPVGSVWIALDKPTYGIHGTPEPSRIGRAESHGCVRLTNWDAAELAKMVSKGVPVEFLE